MPLDNCRYCKKSGHWKKNCLAIKRKESLRNNLGRPVTPEGSFSSNDWVSLSSVIPQEPTEKPKMEGGLGTGSLNQNCATFSTICSEDLCLLSPLILFRLLEFLGSLVHCLYLSLFQYLQSLLTFLVFSSSPANLLGRDLLYKFNNTYEI